MRKYFLPAGIFLFYFLSLISIEFLIHQGFLSQALIPKPTDLFTLFIEQRSTLFQAFLETGFLAVSAFLLATFVGFFLGIVLHQFSFLQKAFLPITIFLQTVPIIALAPLLVIYFGFGSITTLTTALIVAFFPIFMSTLVGLKQITRGQGELMLFLKASRFQRLKLLEIPASVPTLLSGLKTSAGLSVIGVVSGEFLISGGLGGLIDSARVQQRVDLVFASLILLSLLGLCLIKAVEVLFALLLKKYLIGS
jgi:NitT/TauT family transport system permease protein